MQSTQPKPFGKVRNFLWPIYMHEHRKLLPMLALFFLISFIYNLLRCMKVTIMVTASDTGAEVIPFLKWAVLPTAVLLAYLYTKLSNRLSREYVFYTALLLFLGFFSLFLLVLHPHREALELTSLANFLQETLPSGLKGLVAMIRHWPLSIFYILSEMWSAVVLSMLFWGFANEVTTVDEAKRFYAIFAIGVNFSGIFSGQSAQVLMVTDSWEQTLKLQLSVVLIVGTAIILLFRWVNKRIINVGSDKIVNQDQIQRDKSKKISLSECFLYLAKSRYMLYIAILVVAYNIIYHMSDLLWTHQIHQRYPDPNDFNGYINQIASITGIFATLSGFVLSGNVIRRYGWTVTAFITPIILLVMGAGFFGCMIFEKSLWLSDLLYSIFHIPIYTLVLVFGSAQMCLCRAAKYTVFDETKEIAFIPLAPEEQRKGKAVVDGIASRFGKSGGSFIIQMLLLVCGDLALTVPYVGIIFLIVLGLWLLAVRNLGRLVAKSIDTPVADRTRDDSEVGGQPSAIPL